MAVPVAVAKVGWGTEPLTLVEWKAKEGEWVERDSSVLVITTEKIESAIEASASGFLHIIVAEGNKAPIGSIVGMIAETKEEFEAVKKNSPIPVSVAAGATESNVSAPVKNAAPPVIGERRENIRISPVARKMAEEHLIDITKIRGTGPEGRIVREDIEKAVAAKATATQQAAPLEKAHEPVSGGKKIKYTLPLKGMRGIIAERMHQSLSVSAQVTAMGEIDMAELIKLRDNFLGQEKAIGTRITFNDLFVMVAAKALKEKPIINASIIENEIKVWDDINIGIAVALEQGLIVPVIKNADRKLLSEISQLSKSLVEKARNGKLVPEEVTGGTFTITNLGAAGAGWRFESSIINPPESAIWGVGGITDRAVVRNGQIVIRPIMTYSFTYDHRVIDGAIAVQFMARVIELLENPSLLLL